MKLNEKRSPSDDAIVEHNYSWDLFKDEKDSERAASFFVTLDHIYELHIEKVHRMLADNQLRIDTLLTESKDKPHVHDNITSMYDHPNTEQNG